jgi:hypothetical protein
MSGSRQPVPKQPQAVSKQPQAVSKVIVSRLEYGFLPDSRRTGQTSHVSLFLSSGVVSKGGVRLFI